MKAQQRIAVAGATGRVGRHVTNILETDGYDVVAISRSNGVDLVTGDGLADALAGVTTVIDAASSPNPDQEEATEFFTSASRNLQAVGSQAGVQGIVVVSIIGTDKFTEGYGAAKLVHERLSQAGPIPVRILRAAQFHELVPQMVEWGRNGEASYVPKMRTQPIAARTVARALAKLANETNWAEPAPISIPEIAGPREENLVDAARLLVSRNGDRLRIEEVEAPEIYGGDLGANGGLLPSPDAVLAGPTFEEWLDEEYAWSRVC
jgi:uncharacterized protein YbjT (DUF2867 family)